MILTRRRALLGLLAAPAVARTASAQATSAADVGPVLTLTPGDYAVHVRQRFTFGAEIDAMSREEIRRALRGARIVKPP